MNPPSPRVRIDLHICPDDFLSALSGAGWPDGNGSRNAHRPGNRELGHSSGVVLPHSVFLQLLAVLAVTVGLLNLSGCAGGFQGYRPVAPTGTQPANVAVPLGQTATFSVSATGTGTITFQWFKNG